MSNKEKMGVGEVEGEELGNEKMDERGVSCGMSGGGGSREGHGCGKRELHVYP